MKILHFRTSSDAGSIRIGNAVLQFRFPNDYGDGSNTVKIQESPSGVFPGTFMGDFIFSAPDSVYLYEHDCDTPGALPLYTFPPGHWFVLLTAPCEFLLVRISEEARL